MNCRILVCVCAFACFPACGNQDTLSSKIRGTWQMEGQGTVVRITAGEFIVVNDSPMPESYRLTADSFLIKGFEAELHDWKYGIDSFRIVKITRDSLVMKQGNEYMRLSR